MSAQPSELRAALERLRAAGERLRARAAVDVVDSVARVLELWRDPRSAPRAQLAAELPAVTGFSEPVVREGLSRALAGFTRDALFELVRRELGGVGALDARRGRIVTGPPTTALLLAGSLPSPTLVAMLMPLVLRSAVLVKPASRDPLTARVVARSLAAIDADLGDAIEITSFASDDVSCLDAFLGADAVVATGSDETVRAVAARVLPPRRIVCRGHRLSVAAIGGDALLPVPLADALERFAIDVALWDQQGCLSPVALYVAGGDDADVDRVAEGLAAALARAQERLPRGSIDMRTAALTAHERADAELRTAAGRRVALHAGAAWTVVREPDSAARPAPLHRFVRVHPVKDAAGLVAALEPLSPHLAAVGLEGFAREREALPRALADLGVSRTCPFGALQAPPLAWCQDGHGVLAPLAHWMDWEIRDLPQGAPCDGGDRAR